MKKLIIIALIIGLLDQTTKYTLKDLNFKYFTFTTNTGAAFGIFQNYNFVFILISLIVIFSLLYYYQNYTKKYLIAFGLILGGAIGNLVDRLIFGHVIDFIDLKFWPIFNIADSAVTIGFIILLYQILKE